MDGERLAERSLDHVEPVGEPHPLRDAAAPRAVEANRVHLVEIGECPVRLGHVANLVDRGDVAIHRIDRLEGDELGPARLDQPELAVQILRIVVAENLALGPARTDALDHRGMVALVGEDDAARKLRGECAERRPVRDVAGGEDQRRFLSVEVGEFLLQEHVIMVGAGNVSGAARAGSASVDCLVHRLQHRWMLAHAEIVVGTPDGDLARAAGAVMRRVGEPPRLPLQIGEDPVAPLPVEAGDRIAEERFVIHAVLPEEDEAGGRILRPPHLIRGALPGFRASRP